MHIGFDNQVSWWRVTVILPAKGSAIKRIRDEAKQDGRLVDSTHGRPTRSLIINDANQVILSAVTPDTLKVRLAESRELEVMRRTLWGERFAKE